MKILLDHGADVNAQGGHYESALQASASGEGIYSAAQMLLDRGAYDINANDGEFGSALQAASAFGHKEMVELLLSHGEDVNAKGGNFGSALQAASGKDHEEIVE